MASSRSRTRSVAARGRRFAGALLCAGLALGAGACDRLSADEAALASARRSMRALHSGPDAPGPDVQRAVQTEVVTALRPVADRLKGASSAAAWGLMAQAQAGLAQLDASQAAEADARLLNLATQARSSADLYAAQHALASALEKNDPRAAVTDLDQQARSLDAELVKAQGARDKEAERLRTLEAAAAEQTRLANEQRAAELARRATAAEAAPAQRATGYEEAHVIARRAAAFERRAAEIEAEAALVRPLIGVHSLEIDRITRQKQLTGAGKQQLEQSAAASVAQAAEARKGAIAASESLATRLAALDELLVGESTAKNDAAAAGFNGAVASARNAVKQSGQGEAKLSASVALASYLQSLGDIRASHAQTLRAVQATVEVVCSLTPPVGDAAALEASIARLTEMRARADEAAAQAYDGARAALNSAGGRGETADRIKTLASLLPGAPPAEAPPAEPAPAPEGAPAPDQAQPAPIEGDPNATPPQPESQPAEQPAASPAPGA